MNVSFLMEQERLKEIGIKAPFLMAYKNPALEKVNMETFNTRVMDVRAIHREAVTGSKKMTAAEQGSIRVQYRELSDLIGDIKKEIDENLWFFLREIVKVPQHLYGYPTKAPFRIYPKLELKEGEASFQLSSWMVPFYFAVEQKLPLLIDGFYGMDEVMAIATLIVYRIFTRCIHAGSTEAIQNQIPWRYCPCLPVIFAQKFIREQMYWDIEYAVRIILKATIDFWRFYDNDWVVMELTKGGILKPRCADKWHGADVESIDLYQDAISIDRLPEPDILQKIMEQRNDKDSGELLILINRQRSHVHSYASILPDLQKFDLYNKTSDEIKKARGNLWYTTARTGWEEDNALYERLTEGLGIRKE